MFVIPSGTPGPPKLTTVPGGGKVNVWEVTVNAAGALVTEP
jgi:hypothetical protein